MFWDETFVILFSKETSEYSTNYIPWIWQTFSLFLTTIIWLLFLSLILIILIAVIAAGLQFFVLMIKSVYDYVMSRIRMFFGGAKTTSTKILSKKEIRFKTPMTHEETRNKNNTDNIEDTLFDILEITITIEVATIDKKI